MRDYNNYIILYLSLILLILVSTLIKYYPLPYNYSTMPGQFGGGLAFFEKFAIKEGRLLERGELGVYSIYSFSIYGQDENPGYALLRVIISLVTDLEIYTWNFAILFTIVTYVIYLSSILLFLKRKNTLMIILCAFYSILAYPYITNGISANRGICWYLIILLIYILTNYYDKINNKLKIIFIFLSFLLPIIYWTPSAFFLLFIIWLAISPIKVDFKDIKYLALVYAIFFLSWNIYISFGRFQGPILLIQDFRKFLENIICLNLYNYLYGPGSAGIPRYIYCTSLLNKLRLLLPAVFVAIPVLHFTFLKIYNKRFNKSEKIIFNYILSVGILSFFLFVKKGVYGLQRLQEWGTLASILVISKIYSENNNISKFIIILIILTIVFSAIANIMNENKELGWISYKESVTIRWIITNSNNSIIFTDLRLAGGLISCGYLKVTGITESLPINKFINMIEDIYYNPIKDPLHSLIRIRLYNGQKINTILFSKRMEYINGVKAYDYTLKPIKYNFLRKYYIHSKINVIYNNKEGYILYLNLYR